MSAALAITAPTGSQLRTTWTINVTGASNATAYVVEVTHGSGAVSRYNVTTDGSGAGSVKFVPDAPGTISAVLRPAAEYAGTTTAAASLSATKVNRGN